MTLLQQRIAVQDDSQVGEARRVATSLCRAAALGEPDAGRVAIIATELATNLAKHAGGGELLVRELRDASQAGVEVLSVDRGPGMDLAVALRDGHSTTGTRGEGLGAVQRMAQEFDAFSGNGGTVLVARVWKGSQQPAGLQIGAITVPLPGEVESGDAWEFHSTVSVYRFLVVDGLGHGPIAARAANTALEAFAGMERMPGPEAIVHGLHAALRPTRGAALAVAELDLVARQLRFCGVGNIGSMLEVPGGQKSRGLLSHNGIAGHEARRIQEFDLPWPARSVLILHSDGIQTHWKLEAYPGLQARHASVIAGILFRDFRRQADDATVLVVKEP